jgi:hypothetical protein
VRDLLALDEDVADVVDPLRRIDDAASSQQQRWLCHVTGES